MITVAEGTLLVVIAAAIFLLIIILAMSVRIVRQYERMVVLRLGKLQSVRNPGLNLLIPILDAGVTVDLRERFEEIPRQTCITKDNAPIAIDFLVYYRVIPEQSWRTITEVANLSGALVGIATTSLRAVIGDITLDDALAKRDEINQVLRVKLDEVTERWGAKVTAVEIREIEPPVAIQDAMNQQMAAERTRRATVTEADGRKQAAITVAEGEKQSNILRAEGERQAAILRAEGN
jgi:regulator of protease activity HflC (stomatin/prohibitin superfamily)